MSPLEDIIRAQIRAAGPMSVADYMALCLTHPKYGYYATRDPLGAAGDFVTAPEVSQMFGELIGLWLAQVWIEADTPAPFRLIELGPGRGTAMSDALRAARAAPGFVETAELWLVEASGPLRAEQERRLPGARWAGRLEEVPEGALLLFANEFLDALPVRQYLATPEGWREKRVTLEDDRLAWGFTAPLPGGSEAPPGEWREESPAMEAVAREIARRIMEHGGAALIIDYGYRATDRPQGFTLQAVRGHARADPLEAPGEADLTWLIDFDWLGGALRPLETACTTQGAFLTRLGIGARAAALAKARPDATDSVADALDRLTAAEEMGTLFNVLAAWPPGQPPPPGFAESP